MKNMIDGTHSDEALRLFALEVTRQRVAYLKHVKSQGDTVDEGQIRQFEEEIKVEEGALGKSNPAFTNEFAITDLQQRLAFVDLYDQSGADYLKALLLRLEHTKVRMRAEQNHSRPHFHIEYKKEHSASYAVDTLEKLAGNMPRKYERPILDWAATRQQWLNDIWESLCAGEDVREMIMVAPEAEQALGADSP